MLERSSSVRRRAPAGRAFTIVEVLVVIGIIALLIAIILPTLSRSRAASRTTECAGKMRQLAAAMTQYADDHRDWLPRALRLNDPANRDVEAEWLLPYDDCPAYWQEIGFPIMLLPYLDVEVKNPWDYGTLGRAGDPNFIADESATLFDCPSNEIPRGDPTLRYCDYPLDYGLSNWASQGRRSELTNEQYLLADQVWAIAYVANTPGANPDIRALEGWWTVFVHPGESANVARIDLSIVLEPRDDFIGRFRTDEPPVGDNL
ncbi:MAG: type II secretion system protein [Phycisphaerales bacterium]